MTTPRQLADDFHASWLAANPFAASMLGVAGYDDQVPDASRAGEETRRSQLRATLDEAAKLDTGALDTGGLDAASAVTLAVLVEHARQELAELDLAADEYTVSPMPFVGPAGFLGLAARSVLAEPSAAEDYLTRLRRSGTYIDQLTERLRDGAAAGRLPVAPLVAEAITWAEDVLAAAVPAAIAAPQPPPEWTGAEAWRAERDRAATEVVAPALARWLEELRRLLPLARPETAAGLTHLDGGDALYAAAIRTHTTLERSAEELHRTGLEQTELLEERARQLGATLGLGDLRAVHEALRASAGSRPAEEAMEAARAAVRRAEQQAGEVFPPPLPEPCAVSPMPPVVAASGMAPHYSPPRLDGGRPGTYWFNTERPTAGTGWDLEAVAFHEAVPGHHLQLSRVQLLTDLPDLQRLRHLTVFGEGWGLYAEQLAEEMGLYSGTEALLGSLTASLMRAGRLVVDTGIHSLGWSRQQALAWYCAHVPLPEAFLANEIDRYIIWPGQALAYLTGKLELLALRDQARKRLGERFSLPAFHATVLDQGSLPMPVLARVVTAWDGGAP